MTTDRVNPPAWGVKEDPSDLPRILRALESRFAEGLEYQMSALDVAVLVRYQRTMGATSMTPDDIQAWIEKDQQEIAELEAQIGRLAAGTIRVFSVGPQGETDCKDVEIARCRAQIENWNGGISRLRQMLERLGG